MGAFGLLKSGRACVTACLLSTCTVSRHEIMITLGLLFPSCQIKHTPTTGLPRSVRCLYLLLMPAFILRRAECPRRRDMRLSRWEEGERQGSRSSSQWREEEVRLRNGHNWAKTTKIYMYSAPEWKILIIYLTCTRFDGKIKDILKKSKFKSNAFLKITCFKNALIKWIIYITKKYFFLSINLSLFVCKFYKTLQLVL